MKVIFCLNILKILLKLFTDIVKKARVLNILINHIVSFIFIYLFYYIYFILFY